MHAPQTTARPSRRYVRFLCAMSTGKRELRAVCSNIGISGLYVRVSPESARDAALESGTRVMISFRLPIDRSVISTSAVVVWIDPDDRDAAGRPSTGLGLRLEGTDPDSQRRIHTFIETFRYGVLLVDNNAEQVESISALLQADYRVLTAGSAVEAIETMESTEVAVLISDDRLRTSSGIALMQRYGRNRPDAHALEICLSSNPESRRNQDQPTLGRMFQSIKKPPREDELLMAVRRAVDAYSLGVENERLSEELERANSRLLRENRYLRRRLEGLQGFESIVGNSPEFSRALAELERIRHSEATVHLCGETGTGKKLVARALHFGGPRHKRPFVAQNCAGNIDLPAILQEARGGTLFLDQIAELTPPLQGVLLSALQEKQPVRLISATHKDLRSEVQSGRFREDLYFWMMVLSVNLPPLRERAGDVPLLAQHFLDVLCERYGKDIPGFTPDAIAALEAYPWPGNVRELENEIERLVVLSEHGQRVPLQHLSPTVIAGPNAVARPSTSSSEPAQGRSVVIPDHASYDEAMRLVQTQLIERELTRAGSVSRAAEALGMERSRLVKLRQRLGLA